MCVTQEKFFMRYAIARTCFGPLLVLLLMLLLLLITLLPSEPRSCFCWSELWHNGHDVLSPSSAAIMACLQVLQRSLGSSLMVRPVATQTCSTPQHPQQWHVNVHTMYGTSTAVPQQSICHNLGQVSLH
jgi:hypothetical protein